MAHKKSGGSTSNGRDTEGRRLGLKKSVIIYRDAMYIVMGFLHYVLEKSGGVYGNRNYRR